MRRSQAQFVKLLGVFVCIGGCCSGSLAESRVRAFAGSADACVISGAVPAGQREGIGLALLTSAVQSIAQSSLPVLGKYLNDAAHSTSSPLVSTVTDVDLFRIVKRPQEKESRLELNLECLVVVNGEFGLLDQEQVPENLVAKAAVLDPDQMFVKRGDGRPDTSILRRLGLLDFPKSYMEFTIQHHRTAPALRLSPTYLYFRESSAMLNPQEAKDIEVVATFIPPTVSGTLDVNRAIGAVNNAMQLPIVINHVSPGLIHRVKVPATNVDTVWVAEPILPNNDQIQAARQENANMGGVTTFWPNNVFVTYREADKPDLILDILSTAIGGMSKKE
jgi:hypothetical protein